MTSKLKLNPANKIRWGRVAILPTVSILMVIGAYISIPGIFSGTASAELIERVDDRALQVEVVTPQRETINPIAEVTVISNKDISLEQNNRASMQYVGDVDRDKYYIVRLTGLSVGDTEVTLRFSDENNQQLEQVLLVERIPFNMPVGFEAITPWENSEYILDGDSLDVDVNRTQRLLEDYEPSDLIDLNKELGIFTLNNAQLRSDAAYALRDMLREMNEETGKSVTVASGYRSYQTQARTYANWVAELGENRANEVSARPGHSQHQLGTTVDFVSEATGWQISNDFGDTKAGRWLSENAFRFGFVIPYDEDETDTGGYKEESWHFRYVGTTEQ